MMDIELIIIVSIYSAIALVLIYLVMKRTKDKQHEDFEDRDN